MTLADYWEDYDIYQYSTANLGYNGTIIQDSIKELGTVASKVKKVILMDEMSFDLLYDVGYDFDEKTGYLYVYPTEVGAKVSYDLKDGEPYYKIHEISYEGYDRKRDYLDPESDNYVRYGHKIELKERAAEQKKIQTGPDGQETDNPIPIYTIGANPEKKINGKFYISKGAGESATVEFAMTGGEVTVEYKEAVKETKAEPSYAKAEYTNISIAPNVYKDYGNEVRAWMYDMYNRNGIVDKTVYKYVAWTSDITDVDVFYQRIVPKLTGNSNGNINYINYRIETVDVENWDIVSPIDLIITEYDNLEDATGSKHIFNADDGEVSYIIYKTTGLLNIYGVVYAYGKIVDFEDSEGNTVYSKFIQCTESEYAAQFDGDTRKTGDDNKGYKAYEISFGTGLISFNVTSSAGKSATFNINLIKAYDKTSDGKFVLIDYDGSIVVGARVATTSVTLEGIEYKPGTPKVEFNEGKAAKYECVVEKQ
jgi:hypothetical protein